MPSTRLGGAGTPHLWKLTLLLNYLVSRLRRDAFFKSDFRLLFLRSDA